MIKEVTVPIKFKVMWDEDEGKGTMHMRFADTMVNVNDDDGNEIGMLCGALGGHLDIQINDFQGRSNTFTASPTDIWNSFCTAVNREDLLFEVSEDA